MHIYISFILSSTLDDKIKDIYMHIYIIYEKFKISQYES